MLVLYSEWNVFFFDLLLTQNLIYGEGILWANHHD